MPGPPRDPDDWDDVLGQVSDTLDELSVVEGPEREAILGSLRQVLGALGDIPVDSVEIHTVGFSPPAPPSAPPRASVTLVEGGKVDDNDPHQPPTTRPDLRVEPGGETSWSAESRWSGESPWSPGSDEAPEFDASPGPSTPSEPGTEPSLDSQPVRVTRMSGPRLRASAGDAWSMIRLDPALGGEAWQTVFAGQQSRAYRLQCSSGELRVFVDGEPITELASGQSVDVEGALVRVSSEVVVRGRYLRLPG
jgi:hypothetical protein